jgi:hypothetical protein
LITLTAIRPFFGLPIRHFQTKVMVLRVPEKMELRLLARIAPFRVEQPLRDVEDERRRPQVA